MSDASILIVSNLLIFVAVAIIISYLVRRDTLRQSQIDKRYDSIITGLISDVTKQQATYKQEIVDNVKELTLATTNVLVGVERIVGGVEKVVASVNDVSNNVEKFADINTKSVTKVAANVEDVSAGVNKVVTEVDRVAKEVIKVANEVTKVTCEVERVTKGLKELSVVTKGLKELSTKITNDIDNGNIIVNGKSSNSEK